jgi:tetratricopeptide (TPR) repeat protein
MTPRAARTGARRRLAAVLIGLLALLVTLPVCAAPVSLELTPATKRVFARIQEQWLRWLSDSYQDREDLDATVEDIAVSVESLGFVSAPDLGRAAAARARAALRAEQLPQAVRALESAERFAPGLPETAFVQSEVSRASGDLAGAAKWWVRGWTRALRLPDVKQILALNLGLWLAGGTILSGALFTILLAATRGAAMILRLVERFSRSAPRGVAIAIALLVLMWPLALPPFGLWVLPWWSVLLWSQASRSERAVLVATWVILGLVPLLATGYQRLAQRQADPLHQALLSLERGELMGSLGTSIDLLTERLPNDPAVLHLIADVHRRLDQWDLAARHQRQVAELEPQNAAVLVDLGAFSFRKGDYGAAVQFFQMATVADPGSAHAWYDLSQAYSEAYQFDAQRQALEQARKLEPELVGEWIREPPEERVVLTGAGIARIPEIRSKLGAVAAAEPVEGAAEGGKSLPPWAGLAIPAIFVVLALVIGRLVPAPNQGLPEGFTWRRGIGWRVTRVLLPGLPSAEIGEGLAAFGALWLPVSLALLPVAASVGSAVPLALDPAGSAVPVALVGLGLVLVGRVVWDLRTEG